MRKNLLKFSLNCDWSTLIHCSQGGGVHLIDPVKVLQDGSVSSSSRFRFNSHTGTANQSRAVDVAKLCRDINIHLSSRISE